MLLCSVFGFEKGWVEWLVGQLDFSSIASVPCTPSDYYKWIPTDEVTSNMLHLVVVQLVCNSMCF